VTIIDKGADLSLCGKYRYRLWRYWASEVHPRATYIMLNPSTADADKDDPTIRKCRGFAERLGFGGFDVVNLYAFRATDPADLKRNGYPRSTFEDRHILKACEGRTVICAWGAHARGLQRRVDVLDMLSMAAVKTFALAFSDDGTPRHPLMLSYDEGAELKPYRI